MKHLKLSYSGGSGGFLLFHLLLLSGKFYAAFENNESINSIIDKQWNVTDHLKWKQSETWPDNLATLSAATSLDRLYLICNPDQLDNPDRGRMTFLTAKNLMLYTDIDSQIELAYYKKANWFFNDCSSSLKIAVFRKIIQEWNRQLAIVKKDPNWPSNVNTRPINGLHKKIQQELQDSKYTHTHLLLKKFADCSFISIGNYEKDLVNLSILPFLQNADVVVKLQDLVNSNGTVLENLLGIPPINEQQRDLIDHWKKLHPPDLLKKIAINSD